jgi:hypothetical protein
VERKIPDQFELYSYRKKAKRSNRHTSTKCVVIFFPSVENIIDAYGHIIAQTLTRMNAYMHALAQWVSLGT